MNIFGYNTKELKLLHPMEQEPTLNEQEVNRLEHTKPHMPLVNAFVGFVLRSPLHRLLSGSVMLLSVAGRKTGRQITTPVNYIEDENGMLAVLSHRDRTWWRNLNTGAHVTLWLRGHECSGFGRAIRNPNAVTAELQGLLALKPGLAGMLHIRTNDDGKPDLQDLRRAANHYVVIRIHLN